MARLALAYLIRRPVQILAVFGVAIGLLALLVVLAVMNGLIEEDRASVRGPLSDLLLIPGAGEEEASWERYQAVLQEVPEVAAAAPHLVVYALLVTESSRWQLQSTAHGDSNAVQLVGIDQFKKCGEKVESIVGGVPLHFDSYKFQVIWKCVP